MLTTSILLYILGALVFVGLVMLLWRAMHTRVWISIRTKMGMTQVGYMDYTGKQEVTEAYLSGGGCVRAIGRVGLTDTDQNAHTELLTSDYEDDSENPIYTTYGYLSPDGWIYRQLSPNEKPERIGYTACPSTPDKLSVHGERVGLFHLRTVLCAFLGNPKDNSHAQSPAPKPIVTVQYTGLKRHKKAIFSPEARACVYGAFYQLYNKNRYQEYYRTQPYGWSDTALLASIVYCVLFLMLSLADLLTFRFAGEHLIEGSSYTYDILIAFYFVVWALVRQVKIDSIERSRSIQPILNLLNKSLGHRVTDWLIILVSMVAIYFLPKVYDFNYNPMAIAILLGLMINMSIKRNARPWDIASSLHEDEDNEEETDDVINPAGDIARTFDWDLDNGRTDCPVHGNLTLFFTLKEIQELRRINPFYSQRDEKSDKQAILEMFNFLTEHHSLNARLKYIVHYINTVAVENSLHALDKVQFTLDFVQEPNITYVLNRNSQSILKNERYVRFPDEALYDKEGDCNSKALLAAMLFHLMGHNVMYMYSRTQQHAAIGVEVDKDWLSTYLSKHIAEAVTVRMDGKYYIFCETTGDSFWVGGMADGMKVEAFEDRVLLPYNDTRYRATESDEESRIYNWDLDSETGTNLHGTLTLDFDKNHIADLRNGNPFLTYGRDGHSYADNVKIILSYATADDTRSAAVDEVAAYIRKQAVEQQLSELDTIQFALDFVQAPNITYCKDEDSAGIRFTKEYMRYPDEVLYDKEGDCDCKSSLMAALFHSLGYNVIVMLSEKIGHAAIGIECKSEWLQLLKRKDADLREETVIREHNGRYYLYCETTGDGFRVGHIDDESTVADFESIVELLL